MRVAGSVEGVGSELSAQASAEVHCGSCGALVVAGEKWCTSCGGPLAAPLVEAAAARFPGRGKAALLGLAVLAVALGAFATLEFVQHRHEQSRLSRARKEVAQTRGSLSATAAQLARTKSLSQRQAAILAETVLVLKKVDPILSDADRVKQITGSIQSARDTFATDSAQMTADLLFLENYEANPQNYPSIDQYGLIGKVNGELQTVRADFALLTSYDGSFSDASTKFGNSADVFTTSVRRLQHELQKLGAQK